MLRVQRQSSHRTDGDAAGWSVAALPSHLSPDIQAAGVRLLTRAEAMGLIASDDLLELSTSALGAALDAFNKAGIARRLSHQPNAAGLGEALEAINAVVEQSPVPAAEWPAMAALFGADSLAELTNISVSSLRRYANGERTTPVDVAARLHWIAMRVADLAGSYNAYGIERWFQRPRRALGGQAPRDRLTGNWSPDDPRVAQVADLAAAVTTVGAT